MGTTSRRRGGRRVGIAAVGVVAVSTSARGNMERAPCSRMVEVVAVLAVVLAVAIKIVVVVVIVIIVVPNHQAAAHRLVGTARQTARQLGIRAIPFLPANTITPSVYGCQRVQTNEENKRLTKCALSSRVMSLQSIPGECSVRVKVRVRVTVRISVRVSG